MDNQKPTIRERIHQIIYEADTFAGKAFDIALIVLILLSVLVIMLDSMHAIQKDYVAEFRILELVFTILFSIEYALRLYAVQKPSKYAFSFFGIIDFLSVIPTWLIYFFPGIQFMLSLRVLRLLRIFRILKLAHYLSEAQILSDALKNSRRKIIVFLFVVVTLVIMIGSMIYVIEGEENGFTSIPKSIYWAIVTLTTVGYGDIAPITPAGQLLASIIMILGYGILAIPTGIVTAELATSASSKLQTISTQACPSCSRDGHDADAVHCKFCGAHL